MKYGRMILLGVVAVAGFAALGAAAGETTTEAKPVVTVYASR